MCAGPSVRVRCLLGLDLRFAIFIFQFSFCNRATGGQLITGRGSRLKNEN
jgi:hypothetical protein